MIVERALVCETMWGTVCSACQFCEYRDALPVGALAVGIGYRQAELGPRGLAGGY